MSTVMQRITAHEAVVRRVRALALALDLIGEVQQMLFDHAGYKTPLEMANTEDVRFVCEELEAKIHPHEYVYQGEASFDRIRNAKVSMLQAVILVAPESLGARQCREELERRGIAE